ncbi:MAG TPA: hypothetical protein VFZ59_25650 [Verrucomicrobiae bacterium]|nr:hypothetical protein [Verrucomicrobiae bacterium]
MSVQNVSSLFFVVMLFSQLSVRGDARPASKEYFIGNLGAHHRTWMKIEPLTNQVGEVILHTNTAYVEIASGLNYRDATTGEWVESDPAFDLSTEGYAIATRCQHRVVISANLSDTNGVIDLETPDGKRLRSSILV